MSGAWFRDLAASGRLPLFWFFALILHLDDVYWQERGRTSIDAMFVAIAVTGMLVFGLRPVILEGLTGIGGALIGLVHLALLQAQPQTAGQAGPSHLARATPARSDDPRQDLAPRTPRGTARPSAVLKCQIWQDVLYA